MKARCEILLRPHWARDLEQLLQVRERLIRDIQRDLDENQRKFLLSPALRWKLKNLQQLAKQNPQKFAIQAGALEALLVGPQ
jgi:hypothetical protein